MLKYFYISLSLIPLSIHLPLHLSVSLSLIPFACQSPPLFLLISVSVYHFIYFYVSLFLCLRNNTTSKQAFTHLLTFEG